MGSIKIIHLYLFLSKNLNLRRHGLERKIYENLPFPLTFKVYIFNILNKNEVQNGGKPHFQEIGPYVFE